MKTFVRAALAAALLGGVALPAAAQDAPPPIQAPGMGGGHHGMHRGGKGMRFMLKSLSPEGQATMRQAFEGLRNDGTRDGIKAAREQQLRILEADRLDAAALQRAMLEERNLAQGAHGRMQQALLGAYQKLSVADRRALVSSARQAKSWMEQRRSERRQRWQDRRQQNGAPVQS